MPVSPRPTASLTIEIPDDQAPLAHLANVLNRELAYLNGKAQTGYQLCQVRLNDGSMDFWFRNDPVPRFVNRREGWAKIRDFRPAERKPPIYDTKLPLDGAPEAQSIQPQLAAAHGLVRHIGEDRDRVMAMLLSVIELAIRAHTNQRMKAGLAEAIAHAIAVAEAVKEPPCAP